MPDIHEESGLVRLGDPLPKGTCELPIKTAHVALRDIDNDGRTDLVTTILATNDAGQLQPVVLYNQDGGAGRWRFSPLPTDRLTTYYAPGPVADLDRDGRVDLFLPSWLESVPNWLDRNVTKAGRWLTVRVTGSGKNANTMGVSDVVRAYNAGHLGQIEHLLGRADIAVGTGYASGKDALAHLGLGEATRCDLRLIWGRHQIDRPGTAADKFVVIPVTP